MFPRCRRSRDNSSSITVVSAVASTASNGCGAPDSVPCSRSLAESQPRVTSGSRSPTFRLTRLSHERHTRHRSLARDHASPSLGLSSSLANPVLVDRFARWGCASSFKNTPWSIFSVERGATRIAIPPSYCGLKEVQRSTSIHQQILKVA